MYRSRCKGHRQISLVRLRIAISIVVIVVVLAFFTFSTFTFAFFMFSAFTFSAFASTPPYVVLVAAYMAFHTVGEISDAFFPMLASYRCLRVRMTVVACVGLIVVVGMACSTVRWVVGVKTEIVVVVEGSRLPCVC